MRFVFNNFFFNRSVYEMWKKCCRAGKATDDNMTHAHCMLDTWGYKHTLRICKTYWFSTATMFARTRLQVTFILTLLVLLQTRRSSLGKTYIISICSLPDCWLENQSSDRPSRHRFSWFSSIFKHMVGWFPRSKVTTVSFSSTSPDLNSSILTPFL
jgi:hypothetical protein